LAVRAGAADRKEPSLASARPQPPARHRVPLDGRRPLLGRGRPISPAPRARRERSPGAKEAHPCRARPCSRSWGSRCCCAAARCRQPPQRSRRPSRISPRPARDSKRILLLRER
jgi:hypothetical protein